MLNILQDFFFSDLRAGGTKRAGDVTAENSEKMLTKRFTRSIPTIVLILTITPRASVTLGYLTVSKKIRYTYLTHIQSGSIERS